MFSSHPVYIWHKAKIVVYTSLQKNYIKILGELKIPLVLLKLDFFPPPIILLLFVIMGILRVVLIPNVFNVYVPWTDVNFQCEFSIQRKFCIYSLSAHSADVGQYH